MKEPKQDWKYKEEDLNTGNTKCLFLEVTKFLFVIQQMKNDAETYRKQVSSHFTL